MLLLHPAPTCADRYWCPVPLTFSNLRWWCFPFQQLAQILYLHQWWLPSATCAGGLFPSSTCGYIACTYCNLHCGGGGGGGLSPAQPAGTSQWSPAALYSQKMLPPRCALRRVRHRSCMSVYSLCLATAIFGYVIEPHGPDPVRRSLGRGTPASAGTPSQCHLGLLNFFFLRQLNN